MNNLDVHNAFEFASRWHYGQNDRGGEPHMFHVVRVADAVRKNGGTPSEIVAALLHDVVEDTGCTVEQIGFTFSPVVADIVGALTRSCYIEERYRDFIERCCANGRSARLIKECDILDNIERIDDAHLDMVKKRYEPALYYLEYGEWPKR